MKIKGRLCIREMRRLELFTRRDYPNPSRALALPRPSSTVPRCVIGLVVTIHPAFINLGER